MTDTFTGELIAHLEARRDAIGAAVTMPTIEALLDRPSPPARLGGTGPRRRTTTIALAAAAVMLLVVGVLALTRDDTQRVSTLPSSEVRRLAGPGTPFLLPPGGDAVAEFVPEPSDNLETAQIPGMVNGTIDTLISGDVGNEAKLLTLVVTGPRDDTMMDPFSSLRGSDTFDPGDWFDHPDDYPTDGISTTTELPVTSFPGADRAVLATTPGRPSVVAIRRGTQRIAVFGRGLTDRQLSDVAAGVRYDDDPARVDVGAVPRGFRPLVPRATNPKMFDGYSARASGMSVTVTNASGAAFDAAASLLSGVSTPGWTVLRGGPDWVLQLTDNPRQLRGVRDGAWVSMVLPKDGAHDGPVALAAFDAIRSVDIDTFAAALGTGTEKRARQERKGIEDTVERIQGWGGWLPNLPTGSELEDYSLIGVSPATMGGLSGLVPLWDPASGATLSVGDVINDVIGSLPSDPGDTLLETVVLGGRTTELRSWSTIPGDVHAVFDDGDGHRVQTIATGVTAEQVRAYVDSIRRRSDGSWTATPPPGFEPFPLARPADAKTTRKLISRGNGINGAELNFSLPDSLERVTVDVHEPDHAVAANMIAMFMTMGPVERMTTRDVTWYRSRSADGGQHRVAIAGTATRPTVIVASSALTDDQLFEIAISLRRASDAEVEAVFAPLLGG